MLDRVFAFERSVLPKAQGNCTSPCCPFLVVLVVPNVGADPGQILCGPTLVFLGVNTSVMIDLGKM